MSPLLHTIVSKRQYSSIHHHIFCMHETILGVPTTKIRCPKQCKKASNPSQLLQIAAGGRDNCWRIPHKCNIAGQLSQQHWKHHDCRTGPQSSDTPLTALLQTSRAHRTCSDSTTSPASLSYGRRGRTTSPTSQMTKPWWSSSGRCSEVADSTTTLQENKQQRFCLKTKLSKDNVAIFAANGSTGQRTATHLHLYHQRQAPGQSHQINTIEHQKPKQW